MKIKRALEIRDRARNSLYQIFHTCILAKWPASELNEAKNNLLKSLPKRTPQWVFQYLRGVEDVKRDLLHDDHLEFCYVVNNKIYSVLKTSQRYYEKYSLTPKDLVTGKHQSGFYWKDSNRPYFINPDNI